MPAMTTPDGDTTRAELAGFDQFLDGHREISEQLRKDPSLVNQGRFVKDHPALRDYLQDHPGVREELKENPSVFMRREGNFDRREDAGQRDNDVTKAELAQFNRFLESHHEIAEQVRKNPQLVDNRQFVENHSALRSYLQDHPAVRDELRENPNAFMQQEGSFDRSEDVRERDRDGDAGRAERERFGRFLDGHREIAEQVRRNPALINDSAFTKDHPVLQAYLQDHPGIREEARNNPTAFTQGSERSRFGEADRDATRQRDDLADHDGFGRGDEGRDRGADRDRAANFREFLGNHRDVAEQLSRNPDLAKDHDFMSSHPELHDYLAAHPDANRELMNNPQSFVKSAQPQQFHDNGQGAQGTKDQPAKPPAFDPKTGH